ncbi:DUF4333 domain-containing protein [Prauserella halophila]|uniref:DUF4333 domain-containing protein n=1 Tax=Prauserella halophila TaxID=185641 RepID=A0ABP4GVX2_9PSEU|nr:DUF4333 domain-containing protein [Prauserella halophila]MCP2235063.1 protein of unknown function (DUF4333) [Prauserella halophila]
MARVSRLVALSVLGLAAFGLTGCSAQVESDELEKQVKSSLEESTGNEAKGVECPDDLEAETGATTRCTLTAMDGTRLGVSVEVTSVEDSQAKFEIEVDDAPMQ